MNVIGTKIKVVALVTVFDHQEEALVHEGPVEVRLLGKVLQVCRGPYAINTMCLVGIRFNATHRNVVNIGIDGSIETSTHIRIYNPSGNTIQHLVKDGSEHVRKNAIRTVKVIQEEGFCNGNDCENGPHRVMQKVKLYQDFEQVLVKLSPSNVCNDVRLNSH